jgi:hypothetical protein
MIRANLEKRLAELEQKRDQRLTRLWDAYFDHERRVLGADWQRYCEAREREILEATHDPDLLALRARVESDPDLLATWARVYMYAGARYWATQQQGAHEETDH